MSRRMQILVATSNKGFCFFYRLKWPLEALHRKGLVDFVCVDPMESDPDVFGKYAEWADIIIFHFAQPSKLAITSSTFIKEANLNKIVLCEFDDDYTNIEPSNLAYKYFGLKEIRLKNGDYVWKDKKAVGLATNTDGEVFDIQKNKRRLEDMLKAVVCADAVTVTSPILKKAYERYNENTFVFPNYINPLAMPPKKRRNSKGPIIIGWQGGDSHHQDLKAVMPVLKKIKKLYGEKIKFRFFGAYFEKMYKEVNGEFIPWVKPDEFYGVFSKKTFDIGIIPLNDTVFNRSKSNIKWLEYSYYDIASVVSNVSPYKEHIADGVNGLLYDNNDEMFDKLKILIDDSLYRAKIAGSAKREVIKNFTIETKAYQWYQFYVTALKEKITPST